MILGFLYNFQSIIILKYILKFNVYLHVYSPHCVNVNVYRDCCSGVNLYKSVLVSNSERTAGVVRAAMEKHGIEHEPVDDYTLAQLLPNGGQSLQFSIILVLKSFNKRNLYYCLLQNTTSSRKYRTL